MSKFLKLMVGLLLLPACWAASRTLAALVSALRAGSYEALPMLAWWLIGGFAFWVILFLCLPQPIRTYVLGHELTHALWGLLMGARVSRLRVSARGGSVTLSKTNVLITLAPYFFPFYTMLAIALHYALSFFYDLRPYEPFWLALIGLTWGFHATFTVAILLQHQPDIAQHGRIFSYAVIYLLNVLGIGLWIVAVARPTLPFYSTRFVEELSSVYAVCLAGLLGVWAELRARL